MFSILQNHESKFKIMNPNKPHIVHILGALGFGGTQRSVFNLVTHPALQHFQHSVVCLKSDQGQFREKFQKAGVSIYFCPLRWPTSTPIPSYRINRWLRNHLIFSFIFCWRFPPLLKRLKADLVHSHLRLRIGIQAKTVICKAKLPFIWTIRALFRPHGKWESGWSVVFDLVERSERAVITAVSHAALMYMLGGRKMPEDKAMVIYNGIDLSRFETNCGQGRVLRRQWGIPDDAVVFGSAGRLDPIKRFDLLLDASAQVIKKHSNVHVMIAGDGEMRQVLEDQIKRLGIQGHVHLVGYQSDMVQFWREVDVGVVCSDSEGLPMVLLEACASGVACIATSVGGIPEVLTDDSGILVEAGSKDGLVEAMERLMELGVRNEYRMRAREVAKRFSMDKTASQYDALYRKLLGIS